MQVYTSFIIFVALLIFLPDLYLFRRFMRQRVRKSTGVLHWIISIYFMMMSGAILFNINHIISPTTTFRLMMFLSILGAVYLPKLVFCTFDLVFYITKKKWRFIQYIGYGMAGLTFLTILYGIHFTRFQIEKETYEIPLDNLPDAFDGYKIVQITDLHLGSFSFSKERLHPLFDSINAQHPDMIVFTGDMVNDFATECIGWNDYFQELKSKDKMLAILGNHDYGTYFKWEDEVWQELNEIAIRQKIRDLGFDLLLNKSRIIKRDSSCIAFIGIENWGSKPFYNHADLKKASVGTDSIPVKILLSHDPTFWKDSIQGITDMDITLSGHTHAAQIGIDTKHFKWSPAKWMFDYWDGLYKEGKQYIVVSRGIGAVGIPARIGMRPKYSVIILRKASKNSDK